MFHVLEGMNEMWDIGHKFEAGGGQVGRPWGQGGAV
jgi:hypothetical protein